MGIVNNNMELPAPSATPLERLKYLVWLSRKTQHQFAQLIDLDPSGLSRILTGKLPISTSIANRLVVNLGVSKDWFTKGIGLPFPKNPNATTIPTLAPDSAYLNGRRGAPVYDIDATAGCLPLERACTDEQIIGYLDLPRLNPKYPIVRVSGDSMYPKIPNGSFISVRPIADTSVIMWGAIYLVELEDYRMVKCVRRDPDPTKVILHSENPDYDDIEINRDAILKLFLVENIINCQSLS